MGWIVSLWLAACGATSPDPAAPSETDPPSAEDTTAPQATGPVADVVTVEVTGEAGAYVFAVGVRSDETGCDRYADWWEVLTPDGSLVYRRILDHSHPTEQPFVRTGGPVPVGEDDVVRVRAHLHPVGYVGEVLEGSVADGFAPVAVDPGFAADLATADPQPDDCLF